MISGLSHYGFRVRHIAQEHSYVADMWQRLTNPEVLIYLDVSYPVTIQRRQLNWNESEYQVQVDRLRHARQHADLYIDTDNLSPTEVLHRVITYLEVSGSHK